MNTGAGTYDSIVFDLDGTLWDATEPCAAGWTAALQSMGYERILSKTDIASVCGLPTPDCVRALCPEVPPDSFHSSMETIGNYERFHLEKNGGRLYDGVVDGLQILKTRYPLYLVSNCQEWYLQCFLNKGGLRSIFKDWECYGRTQLPKAENLKQVAKRNRLNRPLYVGDTDSDRTAAFAAGFAFAYVSYGFGKARSELTFSDFHSFVGAIT